MRAYPHYRDSGVEWLGEVPEHWEVRPFRYVCRLAYGESLASEAREDGDIPVFGSNGIVGQHDTPNTRAPAIVVGRKGSHGEVNFSGVEAFAIDTTYFVDERYTTSDLPWLYYALLRADLADVSKDSAIPGLSRGDAYAKALPLPPLDEQRAIAAYLDRETERIDALVAKKRLLIERLEEYRSALITRTVTRGLPPEAARAAGLDPSPRLKPSGVEWLGDVPEHWEVRRLRTLADITTGSKDTVDREDGGEYPFFVRSQTVERIDTWSFDGEAVLTAGDGVGVGKVFHYINGRFDYHQRMYKFSGFKGISGKFFFQYFRTMLRFVVLEGTAKSTVDSLRLPMLQDFPVSFPPLREQHAITVFLDRETTRIDGLAGQVERAIERSQEYRTALITAAVTGKVDVRE